MAREGYLVNAGEDTIHTGQLEPKTPKEKRDNWWFYHKRPLIVGLLVTALVVSMVYSIVSKVEPDYTVTLITSYSMPQAGIEELERCIRPYADDRNGDGQVKVMVENLAFPGIATQSVDTVQEQQASLVKLAASASTNESMIYLHDEASFSAIEGNFEGFFLYNDGTDMPVTARDFENAMRPWSDFKAFSEFAPQAQDENFTNDMLSKLYERLRVSVRCVSPTIEGNQKAQAYYDDSMALYKRLESGEPLEAEGTPENGESSR